jgi:hypothetical protein
MRWLRFVPVPSYTGRPHDDGSLPWWIGMLLVIAFVAVSIALAALDWHDRLQSRGQWPLWRWRPSKRWKP